MTGTAHELDNAPVKTGNDERVAHLVLKPDWPIALCGVNVEELFGTKAPGMDRCPDCLRIAADRQLGRPGWEAR